MSGFTLRPYQVESLDAIEETWADGLNRPVVVLPTGCHRAGQRVLMFDGALKAVEDVQVGDLLMGPDSRPRTVLRLARGTGRMVTVRPTKGAPWVVNDEHVLSLVQTNTDLNGQYPSRRQGGVVTDVRVLDYEAWSTWKKHVHKLFRTGVDFPARQPEPTVDPYFLGLVLGDGSLSVDGRISVATIDPEITQACRDAAESYGLSVRIDGRGGIQHHITGRGHAGRGHRTNRLVNELRELGLLPIACADRFVPDRYKLGSRDVRLSVLAGLLDSDGSHDGNGFFDYGSKSRQLADDVAFLARSLGMAAYVAVRSSGPAAGHFRVSVSGATDSIPTRLPRKQAPARQSKKDPLRTGFKVEPTGTVEPFYGFTLDGDHRYLLDDFTVTHNSGKTVVFSALIARRLEELKGRGLRILVLAHREELLEQAEAKIKAELPGVWTCVVKGDRGQSAAGFADVIVASVQTLARAPRRAAIDRIGLVIVDECHRYAAPSFRAVLAHYGCLDGRQTPTVGFTATLTRMDGGLPDVWQSVAYSKKIHWMIKEGYLVPPVARSIEVPGLNLTTTRVTGGDLNSGDLAAALDDSHAFTTIADVWCQQAGDRPSIMFMPDVATAEKMSAAIGEVCGATSEVITGSTPTGTRRAAYERFRTGETRVLVSCMVLTEGFDAPQTSCVVIGRPTLNPGLYIQMVGRGLRLHPGKDDCLVLDIAGASLKHNLAGVNDLESDCAAKCDCGCLSCGCGDRCKCGIRQCGCRCVDQHESGAKACKCAGGADCGCGCPGDMDGSGLDACFCADNPDCPCRGDAPPPPEKEVGAEVLRTLTDVDILGTELAKSGYAWLRTYAGIDFLTVGKDRNLFLLPAPDGGFFLGGVSGSGRGAAVEKLGDAPLDVLAARRAAEELADRSEYTYNNRKASWRRTGASDAQVSMMNSWRIEFPPDVTKGVASDLLSVARLSRTLDARFGKYITG